LKHSRLTIFLAIICVLSLCNIEVKNSVTVEWRYNSRYAVGYGDVHDLPARFCYQTESRRVFSVKEGHLITYYDSREEVDKHAAEGVVEEHYVCEEQHEIPVGGSRTFDVPVVVVRQVMDIVNESVPLAPEPHLKVSLRKITAIKQEPMLGMVALAQQRRRIMMQYPPAGTVWHTPGGVSILTPVLRKDGHEVKQRWGHITGLEHILLAQNKEDVSRALAIIRSKDSDVHDLYEARQIFERTSMSISTKDKFRFERNNVVYQSQYQDGSIAGALKAIANREYHLWYPYFNEVEIPAARDFNPHVYGVSIGDERQLFPGLVLASMVKDALPDCIVVVGGNLPGRLPDPKAYPEFIELFNHLDALVYAEGFQPLQHIADTLDVSTATGTIWRNGNEVMKNPRTTSPTVFQTLPIPALDGGTQQWSPDTIVTLQCQSHCTMACDFCAIPAIGDDFAAGRLDDRPKVKPRSISPRQIALNMQSLGVHKFDIVDELFHIKPQLELGKELRKIGYVATWQCYLTVTDNLLNPQVAKDLYEAGCRSVQLGLETLSKETVFKIHKQWNNPASYERILQNFREAGIHTHVFLMIGLPTEPLHEGLRWVGFLEKHGRNILTIKSGRWRPARYAPEVERGMLDAHVELYPDTKPLQTNRSFRYRSATHSNTKVDAMRDIVEQACRRHWAYNVTSTIPWWINRSRYTWEQLEEMAKQLPSEPDVPHLDDRIAQMRFLVRNELGREADFRTWDELAAFAVTLL
jgi:hypothetical protein